MLTPRLFLVDFHLLRSFYLNSIDETRMVANLIVVYSFMIDQLITILWFFKLGNSSSYKARRAKNNEHMYNLNEQ